VLQANGAHNEEAKDEDGWISWKDNTMRLIELKKKAS
jgi:hypothetical protein